MRIRTLKPEWLDDERLAGCSDSARFLSAALITQADDAGRGKAGVIAAARFFPRDPATFATAFDELEGWYVRAYEVRGQKYYALVNFGKHQVIDQRRFRVLTPDPGNTSDSAMLADAAHEQCSSGAEALPDDESRTRDRDRDREPDREQDHGVRESSRSTYGRVLAAFARHYEELRGVLWNPSTHTVEVEDIAAWVERQAKHENAKPDAVDQRLLENWFGHEWGQKCDFKPAQLLKNIGEVYSPPVIARKDEPDPEAINAKRLRDREREQDRELHEKLAGHGDGASKPPLPLDAMLAGIGQKVSP